MKAPTPPHSDQASVLHSGTGLCGTGERLVIRLFTQSIYTLSAHTHIPRPSHETTRQKPKRSSEICDCVRGQLTCKLTWKTRKWNSTAQRGGEGGWNDMWKLINKYIFSPSYCVLPESISFKEWRLNRLICSELPAGSTRSRCIKL